MNRSDAGGPTTSPFRLSPSRDGVHTDRHRGTVLLGPAAAGPAGTEGEIVLTRARGWLVLALVIAAIALVGGWKWWQYRQYRHAIKGIEAEMAAGRHAIAAQALTELAASSGDSDEGSYLLGVCERARGRGEAAAGAWARVTPGSSFSSRAIEARLTLEIDGGRLAAAEKLINQAAADPRDNRAALRILLLPTFMTEGRLEDARRLVEERWEHLHETGEETSELAINLGRLHIEIRSKPGPVADVAAELDRAGKLAPDDDRVWLGRANLARRTSKFDEAKRWLDACLERRPDDTAVWQARLDFGMASGERDLVLEALKHLPATDSTPAQILRITAWLAAGNGDHEAEEHALARLATTGPLDPEALVRLSELTGQTGPSERRAKWESRRAELTQRAARYQKLFDRNQPIRDAAEMGLLAKRLGQPLEARVFLTVAAATSLHPDEAKRELATLNRREARLDAPGRSMADLIAAPATQAP